MNDKSTRRYVGQAPFTCHRMDLQRRPHTAERWEWASIVLLACCLAGLGLVAAAWLGVVW